jgi:hypothetical protein
MIRRRIRTIAIAPVLIGAVLFVAGAYLRKNGVNTPAWLPQPSFVATKLTVFG